MHVSISFNYKLEESSTQKTKNIIVDLLKENPYLTCKELAEKLNIKEDSVKYQLNNLNKSNKIKRIGSDKTIYWKIIK